MSPGGLAALGALVLLGSSLPLVPTGELVSASAALAEGSLVAAVEIYLVCLVASAAGDAVMFLGARGAERHLPPGPRAWLAARRLAPAVRRVRGGITEHAPQAVITGRLLPGGRAPVIIALGTGRYPLHRFLAVDAAACAAWAAVYVVLGVVGGRLGGSPITGTAIAVACAVGVGLVVRLVTRQRTRPPVDAGGPTSAVPAAAVRAAAGDGTARDRCTSAC